MLGGQHTDVLHICFGSCNHTKGTGFAHQKTNKQRVVHAAGAQHVVNLHVSTLLQNPLRHNLLTDNTI